MGHIRSGAGMVVQSGSVWSLWRSSAMTCRGPSTGTLVKRLATSKLTIRLFFCMIVLPIHSTKAEESFTCESVLPLRGLRILTSSLASR